jgi:hypothetical protein
MQSTSQAKKLTFLSYISQHLIGSSTVSLFRPNDGSCIVDPKYQPLFFEHSESKSQQKQFNKM